MKSWAIGGLLSVLVCLSGCGRPTAAPTKIEATADTLKPRLESVAKTGYLGSAAAGMRDAIQKLPGDKSADLLKDFDQLEKAKSPDDVKAIAQRMVGKL